MGIGIILQQLLKEKKTNVNEVAVETGVSPSTLYSIIKRDSMKASIDDLYKVAHYLGVTLDYFYSNYQAQTKTSHIVPLSLEANEVTKAYEKADFGTKNAVRKLLDLSPQTETSRESSIDDEIEAFRQELIAEQKGTTSSASGE